MIYNAARPWDILYLHEQPHSPRKYYCYYTVTLTLPNPLIPQIGSNLRKINTYCRKAVARVANPPPITQRPDLFAEDLMRIQKRFQQRCLTTKSQQTRQLKFKLKSTRAEQRVMIACRILCRISMSIGIPCWRMGPDSAHCVSTLCFRRWTLTCVGLVMPHQQTYPCDFREERGLL